MHYKSTWIVQAIVCLCVQNASSHADALRRDTSRDELRHTPQDSDLRGTAPQLVFEDAMVETSSQAAGSVLQFTSDFQLLGPFQIGTREATWGADPLESYGGFHGLEYDPSARFRTSLAINGTTSWTQLPIQVSQSDDKRIAINSHVSFSNLDWQALQSVYGWAALQWQAWARGEFSVQSEDPIIVKFYTPQILEFWIDDEHYFGGDLYAFQKVPVTVRLAPGAHRIDVRLARDTRAMGAVGAPDFDLVLILEQLIGGAQVWIDSNTPVLVSDYVGPASIAIMASPYVSVTIRNNLDEEILINAVKSSHTECIVRLVSDEPLSIVADQSRPVAIYFDCGAGYQSRIAFSIKYHVAGKDEDLSIAFEARPKLQVYGEPHKVTYMHPGGIVSYAVLRPPSPGATQSVSNGTLLPVLLALHGAGVETDSHDMKHSFDALRNLPAWALFPSGATPWCGDDWHIWGSTDVQAAVHMIPNWINRFKWATIGVDVDRWLLAGHSNGGQGAWYLLTHHPDKVIAAAPLSGYTSIQNYVPYTFWRPADTGRTAIVQAALNGYKNELMLPNVQGIPILQQHGSSDDNVPPYHSRLMSQLIYEAGAESIYHEFPGKPHYWDGVYTTEPLAAFFEHFLVQKDSYVPFRLNSFSVVCINPGDTSSKFGLEITQLLVPGQLARIDVNFDPLRKTCVLEIHNVRQFYMPEYFLECKFIRLNRQSFDITTLDRENGKFIYNKPLSAPPDGRRPRPFPPRQITQLGAMDAILHTHGAFTIIRQSSQPLIQPLALQISRNLLQYFSADSLISSSWDDTVPSTTANAISLAIGPDLPPSYDPEFPIWISPNGAEINIRHVGFDGVPTVTTYLDTTGNGLAAIFLRPLLPRRLELVVWGADEASLAVAARLVPMLTGVGQPDFVVLDRRMLAKGVDAVLAMGFLDTAWEVSVGSSFFS